MGVGNKGFLKTN